MKKAWVPNGSKEYNRIFKFRASENVSVTAWLQLSLVFVTKTKYEKNFLKNHILPSLPKLASTHDRIEMLYECYNKSCN